MNNAVLMQQLMWFFAITSMALYLLPYLLLGADARWMIWDNLDSNFASYKILIESGALFAPNSTLIEQALGGVPRGTMASEFDVFVWLYFLFGPENSYIINRIAQTLIGFGGMYFLLKRHVFLNVGDATVYTGVALCFSLLPFWPFGGLSVAGLPLALYAMLNIRQSDFRVFNWLIILIYPFYSSLVLSGFFFLAFVSLIWLFDVVRGRKSSPLFYALVAMSAAYILTHYRLIFLLTASDFLSHRLEFGSVGVEIQSVTEALRDSWGIFTNGQPHAHSLHGPVIIIFTALSSLLVLSAGSRRQLFLFYSAGIFIVLTSLFYGLNDWPPISNALTFVKSLIPMQLQRFHFLHPMLWMIMFGVALAIVAKHASSLRWVVIGAVGLQVAITGSYHEIIKNRNGPTATAFFAVDQFEALADVIGKPKQSYRVASLGIHPGIALYNGFYTIDGYWSNYPLEYKREFRSIIRGELEKNSSLKNYYDNWGSRVYIFSDELRRDGGYVLNYKGNDFVVSDLALDPEALSRAGAQYLISAVRVDEGNNPYLNLVKKFEDDRSAWDLYLYKIISDG